MVCSLGGHARSHELPQGALEPVCPQRCAVPLAAARPHQLNVRVVEVAGGDEHATGRGRACERVQQVDLRGLVALPVIAAAQALVSLVPQRARRHAARRHNVQCRIACSQLASQPTPLRRTQHLAHRRLAHEPRPQLCLLVKQRVANCDWCASTGRQQQRRLAPCR
eukprot:353152-Chlamydomonas_euryale.AAC.3